MGNQRPLLWAMCDDSGFLLDPRVGAAHKSHITQADIDYFNSNWKKPGSWTDFRNGASKSLQVRLLSYADRDKCANAEKDQNNIIVGIDANGECVYWLWKDDLWEFECLNDGT